MKRSPQRKAALRRTASTSARLQDRNRKKRRNFFLERLEDRSLMATLIWTGNTDLNLATATNWQGNVAPQQDDSLVFPAGVTGAKLGTLAAPITNSLAAGTRFRSITISDNYFMSGGNALTLVEGVTFNSSNAAATAQLSIPLTLAPAASTSISIISANAGQTLTLGTIDLGVGTTLTTDGKGNISASGVISGSAGAGITKQGDGTLILGAANTFEGLVDVKQGVVSVTAGGATNSGLGSTAGGTIVRTGAQVQVSSGATAINENFVINDIGPGLNQQTMGAIVATGNATLGGTITLGNNTGFGVTGSNVLTITGQIMGVPSGNLSNDAGFTKFGTGRLIVGGSGDNVVTGQVTVLEGELQLAKTSGEAFKGNLVIGDNRDLPSAGVAQATVTYNAGASNQIPEVNFYKTGVNSVTVNSNGLLNMGGMSATGDTIGHLEMYTGRSTSAQVTTVGSTGRLKVLGDITVNRTAANSPESSGASPSAKIDGNLDIGALFSGAGTGNSGAVKTINVGDSATANIAPDLTINAVISDTTGVPLKKLGGGTLLLTGLNTYTGPTRIEAGVVDIGLTSAASSIAGPFGNSTASNATLDIAGGFIQATNNTGGSAGAIAPTIFNNVNLDGNLTILGSTNITFSGTTQMTGSRTITTVNSGQTTTFTGSFGEAPLSGFTNLNLTKQGKGTLELKGTVGYTGSTIIGVTGATQTADAGTLRLSGTAVLPQPFAIANSITIGQGGVLELNNANGANNDRLPDNEPITLIGGTLKLIGNNTYSPETVGQISMTANFSDTLEADNGGVLTLNGLTRGGGATMNFVTNSSGAANGLNPVNVDLTGNVSKIRFASTLNSPDQASNIPSLNSGILPWGRGDEQ
jgi:fibronectin-binding autotransporter adhesin